jgi:IclR family transcriptional regulator, KDG regulon repressor
VTRIVTALERGTTILELFLDGPSEWSQPEIVEALRLPRSTVHELVGTLLARGYIERVADGTMLSLGAKVFELGHAYAKNLDLVTAGNDVLATVTRETEETCQLAVLDGTEVLYVAKVDSTHAVRMVSAVGRRVPAHCTAIGKVLLATLSDSEVQDRFEVSRLPTLTSNSIRTIRGLLSELEQVRTRGYAVDDCESNADVRCVAVPVTGHRGQVIAAMSISVPVWRAEGWPDGFRHPLSEGARELSRRLGSSTPASRRTAPRSATGSL